MGRLVDGVLETALYADDLPTTAAFYEEILGLPRLFGDDRLVALDAGRRTILLIFLRGATTETVRMPGGTIPPHDGQGPIHVAFAVTPESMTLVERRLAEAGIPIEGETRWPRGSRSIYMRDPAGHLVECATPGLWATY